MNRLFSLIIVSLVILCSIFLIIKGILEKRKFNKLLFKLKNNEKTLVILIAGQSNAANYCEKLFSTCDDIFMYYNGRIKRANDPLIGASGTKGSIWIPFANYLLEEERFSQVLLICLAEGGSTVYDWTSNGKFHQKLEKTILELNKYEIHPNYVLWQQGEEDNLNGTSYSAYKERLIEVLNSIKYLTKETPVIISLTSFNPSATELINHEIRRAQSDIINEYPNIYYGPDTDQFNDDNYRYDGIHFSNEAVNKISYEWSQVIKNLE